MAWLVVTACGQAASRTGSSDQAPFDQRFIDMMVPHHEGAIGMAEIAKQRAQHPEIKQMAVAIVGAQASEISQMKGWRKVWYGSDQTPPMDQMPMVGSPGTELEFAL